MDPMTTLIGGSLAISAASAAAERVGQGVAGFAQALASALGAPGPTQPSAGNSAPADAGLTASAQQILNDLARELNELLAGADIEPGAGFHLHVASEGGDVQVAGEHPRSDAIEAVLAQNPDLVHRLQSVAAALVGGSDGTGSRSGFVDLFVDPFGATAALLGA
ncbi:MAG: hypothetical protein WDZ59_03600 [Pirellulales bacterium]